MKCKFPRCACVMIGKGVVICEAQTVKQRITAYWKKHLKGEVPKSDAFWASVSDQQVREAARHHLAASLRQVF